MERTRDDRFKTTNLLLAVTGLIAGLAFYFAGQPNIANVIWIAGVVPALIALVIEILRSIGRGEVGLDIVAALSMSAALVFGETLAAAVVAVMYSGGTFLEAFAEGARGARCTTSCPACPGRRPDIGTAAWRMCRSTRSHPATVS